MAHPDLGRPIALRIKIFQRPHARQSGVFLGAWDTPRRTCNRRKSPDSVLAAALTSASSCQQPPNFPNCERWACQAPSVDHAVDERNPARPHIRKLQALWRCSVVYMGPCRVCIISSMDLKVGSLGTRIIVESPASEDEAQTSSG